ncbi:hypothetical protein HHK36_007175 [Tetracentron sinense]|uniref:Uncharacterized protein n=1 Tax=Tetracentron sinense TaxID=13715 RepID=A0A834ZIF7_TETSI|nr:hypothetical protein HHK36_007175 [Tetracentron sinense]
MESDHPIHEDRNQQKPQKKKTLSPAFSLSLWTVSLVFNGDGIENKDFERFWTDLNLPLGKGLKREISDSFFSGDFRPEQCRPSLGMAILDVESCMILEEGEKSDEIGTLSPQNENIDLGDSTSNKATKKVNAPYVGMHFDSIEEARNIMKNMVDIMGFQFEFDLQTKLEDV